MAKTITLLLILLAVSGNAQYTETFPTNDRGLEGPCSSNNASSCTGLNNFADVNWNITGSFSTGMSQAQDFAKTISNVIHFQDVEGICWDAPTLDISSASPVSLSIAVEWDDFDDDQGANAASHDYLDIEFSVNGGAYTRIANVVGTGGHTINVTGNNQDGTTTVSASGISGNTLDIRMCVHITASSEFATGDNVSVPESGVSPLSLPVELRFFDGQLLHSAVKLNWETRTEANSEGFYVERSGDGQNFETIGFLKSAGTTLSPQFYQFEDSAPLGDMNYYRLRQKDFNGRETLHKTISVWNANGSGRREVMVFPNPANSFVNVHPPKPKDEPFTVELHDFHGKLIRQTTAPAFSEKTTLDLSETPSGFYFIKIYQGQHEYIERFVLNKK